MRIRYWSSDVCSSDLFARGFAEFAIETIERRTEIGRGAAVAQLVETKHLLVQRLLRARIVPIEAFAEIDAYQDDLRPSPEPAAGGRIDYDRLLAPLAGLPHHHLRIARMLEIVGLSQREILLRLYVRRHEQAHVRTQDVRGWGDRGGAGW